MKANVSRLVTGIAIIAVGVGFLLGNLNVFNFNSILSDWWPVAVILAGILMFISNSKNYVWALIVGGFGVFLLLRQLNILDVSPWQIFWPAVIILVGVSIIFNRAVGMHRVSKQDRDDLSAVMGGHDQKNTSDDYKGSKLTAVMGGVKLDLRGATIKKEATVEIFSFWGGVELIVPPNVMVKNQLSCIAGGAEDKSEHPTAKNAPVLHVTGDVVMSGVEIKNYA